MENKQIPRSFDKEPFEFAKFCQLDNHQCFMCDSDDLLRPLTTKEKEICEGQGLISKPSSVTCVCPSCLKQLRELYQKGGEQIKDDQKPGNKQENETLPASSNTQRSSLSRYLDLYFGSDEEDENALEEEDVEEVELCPDPSVDEAEMDEIEDGVDNLDDSQALLEHSSMEYYGEGEIQSEEGEMEEDVSENWVILNVRSLNIGEPEKISDSLSDEAATVDTSADEQNEEAGNDDEIKDAENSSFENSKTEHPSGTDDIIEEPDKRSDNPADEAAAANTCVCDQKEKSEINVASAPSEVSEETEDSEITDDIDNASDRNDEITVDSPSADNSTNMNLTGTDESDKSSDQKEETGNNKEMRDSSKNSGAENPEESDADDSDAGDNTSDEDSEPGPYKPYVCLQCGRGFKDKYNLNKHMSTHLGIKMEDRPAHSKIQNFSCPNCPMAFVRKSNFTNHLKLHEEEEKSNRKPAGKKLKERVAEKTSTPKRKCRIQSEKNAKILRKLERENYKENYYSFSKSLEAKKEVKLKSKYGYTFCNVCNTTWPDEEFEHHLEGRKHFVELACERAAKKRNEDYSDFLLCPDCESQSVITKFSIVKDLRLHYKKSHGVGGSIFCEICKNSITGWKGFLKHLTTEKHINNTIVKKSPGSKKAKLPFACAKCPKKFATEKCLKSHQTHHGKEDLCEFCGQSFSTYQAYRYHKKAEHYKELGITFPPAKTSSVNKPFKCPKCPIRHRNRRNLRLHLMRLHKVEKGRLASFKCEDCSRVFNNQPAMIKHKKEYHKQEPVERLKKCKVVLEKLKKAAKTQEKIEVLRRSDRKKVRKEVFQPE